MKNIELNKSDIINIGDVHSFIETQKYLELIIENSSSIQRGESIIITPNGILNSKKKRRHNSNEVLFGIMMLIMNYLLIPLLKIIILKIILVLEIMIKMKVFFFLFIIILNYKIILLKIMKMVMGHLLKLIIVIN